MLQNNVVICSVPYKTKEGENLLFFEEFHKYLSREGVGFLFLWENEVGFRLLCYVAAVVPCYYSTTEVHRNTIMGGEGERGLSHTHNRKEGGSPSSSFLFSSRASFTKKMAE